MWKIVNFHGALISYLRLIAKKHFLYILKEIWSKKIYFAGENNKIKMSTKTSNSFSEEVKILIHYQGNCTNNLQDTNDFLQQNRINQRSFKACKM